MPRPLIPDTVSRACIPASLQPCNQLEKECCASLPCGTVTDIAAEHTVSDNEHLETFYLALKNPLSAWNRAPRLIDMDRLARPQTMMRKPSLGSANSSCYVDITIQFCPAEKMNAR
jgi:hypothetical protein